MTALIDPCEAFLQGNLQKKSLLIVFGGSGFIGSHVVAHAEKKEISTISLSRSKQIFIHNNRNLHLNLGRFDLLDSKMPWIEPLIHFINKNLALREIKIVNCAGVFHEAPNPTGSSLSCNEVITEHVIKASGMLGVKHFIHLSSSSFYASTQNRIGIKEDEVIEQPLLGLYAQSKWKSEKLVKEAHKKLPNILTVVLRPQLVYGIDEHLFLPQLIQKAASHGLPRTSPQGPFLDMTHVDNLRQIIFRALIFNPSTPYNVFNVSDGTPIYLLKEIQVICEKLRLPFRTFPISQRRLFQLSHAQEIFSGITDIFTPKKSFHRSSFGPIQASLLSTDRTLDLSRAFWLLNYTPEISTQEGLDTFTQHLILKRETA
jgi:nucleoside-diphosphate-sugar epimerase